MADRKRVRFTEENTYYSLELPSASSSTPNAPPSRLSSIRSATEHVASPQLRPQALDVVPLVGRSIHIALAYKPHKAPLIAYDCLDHPSHAYLRADVSRDIMAVLSDSAVNPPVPSLTLVSNLLAPPIVVHPHYSAYTRATGEFVTVFDVLIALYRFLRFPLSATTDCRSDLIAITNAYHSRYQRIQSLSEREVERRKGVKRVDLLKGRTAFAGLIATRAPNEWFFQLA